MICSYTWKTDLGLIRIVADESAVYSVVFVDDYDQTHSVVPCGMTSALELAVSELNDYFAGNIKPFTVKMHGAGTAFQRNVWRVVEEIPCGQTRLYGDVARDIGSPLASRAVGSAVGANACAIIIPCHRVIAAHGLGGYRYGLERKEWLLKHEAFYRYKSI